MHAELMWAAMSNDAGETVRFAEFPRGGVYPLQIGECANDKNLNYGGSGWCTWSRCDSEGSCTCGGRCDFNMDFTPADTPSEFPTTCELRHRTETQCIYDCGDGLLTTPGGVRRCRRSTGFADGAGPRRASVIGPAGWLATNCPRGSAPKRWWRPRT